MGETFKKVEFSEVEPRFERAKEAVKYWKESFEDVWAYLQDLESKEGRLDEDDPRMTAVKISAMNLSASKDALKEVQNPN